MATCKGCGARIVFVKTTAGKQMPCNPKMVGYRAVKGAAGKIVTADGRVVSAEITNDLSVSSGVGYIPHWSTCPNAESFKSK